MSNVNVTTIKTANIKSQNQTTQNAITIDSSGRYYLNQKPCFNALASSATTRQYASGVVVNYLINATVNFPSGVYNTTSCRFTAPISGYYYFFTNFLKDGVTAQPIDFRISKNGIEIQGGYSSNYVSYTQGNGGSIIFLNTNDYVDVRSTNGNGIWWNDSNHSYWMGFLIDF
jgi:hypothetical protein